MKIQFAIIIALFTLTFLQVNAVENCPTSCLCHYVDCDLVSRIRLADDVRQLNLIQKGFREYSIEGTKNLLSQADATFLKEMITNSKNYTLGITKSCPFIAEYALSFDNVVVLFSPSGKQIKILDGEESVILDCDPCFNELMSYFS